MANCSSTVLPVKQGRLMMVFNTAAVVGFTPCSVASCSSPVALLKLGMLMMVFNTAAVVGFTPNTMEGKLFCRCKSTKDPSVCVCKT